MPPTDLRTGAGTSPTLSTYAEPTKARVALSVGGAPARCYGRDLIAAVLAGSQGTAALPMVAALGTGELPGNHRRLLARSRSTDEQPTAAGAAISACVPIPAAGSLREVAIAQVTLRSGRGISLLRLEVSAAGTFLEGYPSARWNDRQLAALTRNLAERYPHFGIYVIDPPRTRPEPPHIPPGPFGPVELLPPLQCIGVFGSHPIDPDADSARAKSTLVVAWYQAEPVLPFDDDTRHRLEELGWDRLARDHER